MTEESFPLFQVLKKDTRYPLEAYIFIRESLRFAADVLELGTESPNTDQPVEAEEAIQEAAEKHMTGQQLCEAIRQFALNQFGYMSKVVLSEWGIRSTSDFGNIVYNMIGAGLMRKSESDRRSDFDDVYDFESEFDAKFEIANVPVPPRA